MLTKDICTIVVACQACDNSIPNFHFTPIIESSSVSDTILSQNATYTPKHPLDKNEHFYLEQRRSFPSFSSFGDPSMISPNPNPKKYDFLPFITWGHNIFSLQFHSKKITLPETGHVEMLPISNLFELIGDAPFDTLCFFYKKYMC